MASYLKAVALIVFFFTLSIFSFAQTSGLSAMPDSLDFGTIPISTSQVMLVNISSSLAHVTILNIYLTGEPGFSIHSMPSLPLGLNFAVSTQIEVAFSPVLESSVAGILHVATSTGLELEVGLRGAGFRIPMFHMLPDYDFGEVIVGNTASTVLDLTLSSPWEAWVGSGEVVAVTITGSADYSLPLVYKNDLVEQVTYPVTLESDDTLHIQINYQPMTPGTAAATLNVAGSDGMIYNNILTGNGMAGGPEIYVNPNSLIIDLYAGTETDGSFIIGNRGDAELDFTIDGSTLPSWINLSPGNGVVANGDSTSINVHINATAVPAGNYSYLIEIISNDPTHASTSLMITVVITNAALLADFHADQLTGHPPLAVQFHDDSISDATAAWSSINSWNWDFENDGVFDSAEQNPLHTYSQPGMYSVRLVVGTDTGLTATKLRTGYIELVNSAPVISVPYPLIPDMVEDTPWGPTNLSHVFSDPDSDPLVLSAKGSAHLSASVSPDGLYIVPAANWFGTETITLTAIDPFGLGVAQPISVTVASVNDAPVVSIPPDLYFIRNSSFNVDFAQYINDPDNPDSEISIQLSAISVPQVVYFAYTPLNMPNIVGQLTAIFTSPSQVDANQVIQIQVSDNAGRLLSFATFNMHVLQHFNPQITLDDIYQFTGQSVGFNDATLGNPDHWLWSFGDGNTSTEQHPVHQYLSSGTFDVSLSLGNSQVPEEDRTILMPGLIHLSGTAVTVDFIPSNWTIQGSPYNLVEDLIIPPDDLVVIEPNVEVNCFGEEPLDIQGSLQANGVTFRSPAGSGLWGGLRFRGSSLREPSSLQNCQLIDAQNPIIIEDSSPLLSNLSVSVSDTTAILNGTAIRLQGQCASQLSGLELVNYQSGIHIETDGTGRDTPVLSNVRIRNSSSAIREVGDPSVAITLVSTAILEDVEISEYDTGLVIQTTEERNSSAPSLTNVRIRNSSSAIRSEKTGIRISGNTAPQLSQILIENASLGLRMENITASYRDTPSLTNVRIRNTSSAIRSVGTGIEIENVPKLNLESVEVDSFALGIKINATQRDASTPSLTNVRIRNTSSSIRYEGKGLQITGSVFALINDLQIDDYMYGLSYQTSQSGRSDLSASLSNVRIRNTSSSIRQLSQGAFFKGLGRFSLNDVEVNDYNEGIRIEADDLRTDTSPSLTNVRIRNSSSSIRTQNTGLYLGAQVRGSLVNSRIENASLGIFVAQGNRTVMENNVIKNCLTGIKAYGEDPLPLKKTILFVETDFLDTHQGMVQAAFDLNGNGPWNIYQNSVFRYPKGIKASFAQVYSHTNIFWTDNGILQPVLQSSSTVLVDYSDIWSPSGVFAGIGNINAHPLFANTDAGNFQLLRDSPCIDAGGPSAGTDSDGSIADQGAIPYLHRAAAIVTPRFVVVGTSVTFQNNSLGHDYPDTQISWDIGNDGSVESASRDFGFVFNTPGVYSLGLTMQSGSLTDYVIYPAFIVVSSQALLAPQNPTLSVNGSDIAFLWDPVSQSVEGLPVDVQFYIVYKADKPDGFYAFSSFVVAPQTSWTDFGAALNERAFYLVLGFAGSRADLLEYITEHPQLRK